VAGASGPSGPSDSAIILGHSAALHSHAIAPAQFVGLGNAAHFLIRAAKPSQTAGTLCEMPTKFFEEFMKNIDKIFKKGYSKLTGGMYG
jgi:hypothetical protein